MKSSAEMSMIRVCPGATRAAMAAWASAAPVALDPRAGPRQQSRPVRCFQLYTWHERRPLAHWQGQGLGPNGSLLDPIPQPYAAGTKPAKA
jgi:hypothetical protein